MKDIVLSGIRATGQLHLGNYFGALRNFVKMQEEGVYDANYFIADLHALTTAPDPNVLHANVKSILAEYLAAGLDPEKSTIFVQSDVPEISEMYLLLNMHVGIGELMRTASFKDKARKQLGIASAKDDEDEAIEKEIIGNNSNKRVNAGLLTLGQSMAVIMGANVGTFVQRITPRPVANFVERRFAPADMPLPDGAAYDLVRASVNLVVAALLIALGTSLKLPLSTTYVTFMVAMGSSLADRAWSRESAVFRVTGVLTVIGGWFITAGVAFTACFFVALAMRFGGVPAIVIIVGAGIYALIHSQRRFAKKQAEEEKEDDVLFHQMCRCLDPKAIGGMLLRHLSVSVAEKTAKYSDILTAATDGLFQERRRMLKQAERDLETEKMLLKSLRRRETIGLRRADVAGKTRIEGLQRGVYIVNGVKVIVK